MKGHKEYKHRETGGFNEADEDVKDKPMRYTADSKVNSEAEERKRGGRMKRAHGGEVEMHHKDCKCRKCWGGGVGRKRSGKAEHEKKHVGEVYGEHAKHHAGRKPRKDGGRASNEHPFSSARAGTPPPGRKMEADLMD